MTPSEFSLHVIKAFQIFQSMVPIDKGNLRNNATTLESMGNDTYKIIVSGDIAPYNVFTNEPWLSPKWNGKKNPNEGWIESSTDLIAQILAAELGGELRRI